MTNNAKWNPLDHHRGPFQLVLARPRAFPKRREYPFTFETLATPSSRADAEEEARCFLDDPRDNVVAVYVYSVPGRRHVTTFTPEGND